MNKAIVSGLALLLLISNVAPSAADLPCPDSLSAVAKFTRTYQGDWMPGQPYDYVTISSNGRGESLADVGITIEVLLKSCTGEPFVGEGDIVLFNSGLCICPGGNLVDGPTDANGYTTFTGKIYGGGCVESLDIFWNGLFIDTVPVKVNSTDLGFTSPCYTDASDLGAFAARLGRPEQYSICYDYNESGPPTIDASDLSYFAYQLGSSCEF